MLIFERLAFGFRPVLPLILQAEATECGLACVTMIAGYHKYTADLMSLRRRFPVSLKGATLASLIQVANHLKLATRPVKLDLQQLSRLRLPCILHWEFNHFVVLKRVDGKCITIHDPALGVRTVSLRDTSDAFTGVALELWPTEDFTPKVEKQSVRVRGLLGPVNGLVASCSQVLLFALALEAFALLSPLFLQLVIDNVLISADRDLLITLAVGFALVMIVQQALSAIRSWVLLYMSTTLSLQWRANVFSHLIRLPIQYFEKRHLGDVVSRFETTDVIQRTLTTSFLEAILDGVMTVATLLIMFLYSPTLSMIAVGAMLVYAAARWAWYGPLHRATEEQIVHTARQDSHMLETLRGVKTIKLFLRQDERRASWLTLVVEQINAEIRMARLQLLYKVLNGLLFGAENILIILLGARLVLDGNFSVGVLTAFIAYKSQFDSRVSALIDKCFEVKMLNLQGERLADIVLTEPEFARETHALVDTGALSPSVTVRGLRYRYVEQEPYVLDGIDFEIPAGSSVAIAGPSGCGKTTLINALLGIVPVTEGDILIGDIPLSQFGVDQLRSIVGTVLQDDVLFAGSIADNISVFDPKPDRDWIVKCAELAAVSDDICKMPMGYNTLVGDMGTVLSGGQKQRVLLARALYKRPRILLLDEATSHLDIDKERQVNQAIKRLNITRIIVAHRPETIASAGRVIVMVAGRIVHDGAVHVEDSMGEARYHRASAPYPQGFL